MGGRDIFGRWRSRALKGGRRGYTAVMAALVLSLAVFTERRQGGVKWIGESVLWNGSGRRCFGVGATAAVDEEGDRTENREDASDEEGDSSSSNSSFGSSSLPFGARIRPQQGTSLDRTTMMMQAYNDLVRRNRGEDAVGDVGDDLEDGLFDPLASDPSCEVNDGRQVEEDSRCWTPPASTIERVDEAVEDPADTANGDATAKKTRTVDKHWGSDENVIRMRDRLRRAGAGVSKMGRVQGVEEAPQDSDTVTEAEQNTASDSSEEQQADGGDNRRPPIFMLPGLAATRLVAWVYKACTSHPLLSDIRVQDYVWLNINMVLQSAAIDVTCWQRCLTLGLNQTDMDEEGHGCKLRPDEGLDAISSLAPGSIGSSIFVGGTNTVYAWLTQWLADNLGYDVSSIVGLPYDWRLSPDVMERRDGFLTLTRRRIEAAVKSNGAPGIMVAHSMGNTIFRYFLEWLRNEMREEVYARYVREAKRRATLLQHRQTHQRQASAASTLTPDSLGWVGNGGVSFSSSQSLHPPAGPTNLEDILKDTPAVEYSVSDRMFTLANSFVASIDEWWKTYFAASDSSADGSDSTTTLLLPVSFPEETTATANNGNEDSDQNGGRRTSELWELAQIEGDAAWLEWIETHIWTYVGLSAPLLGAAGPVRAVLSGENMGLPITDETARTMELSFGSTNIVHPLSTERGFCRVDDDVDEGDDESEAWRRLHEGVSSPLDSNRLACLDDIVHEIDSVGDATAGQNPWEGYEALRTLLKKNVDWDSDFPLFQVVKETCEKTERPPCSEQEVVNFGPHDTGTGEILSRFSQIWNEKDEPLRKKREQFDAFLDASPFTGLLDTTWDRPHIKHVIMAYGVDVPTEVGYQYRKEYRRETDGAAKKTTDTNGQLDGVPRLSAVIWEEANGMLAEEPYSIPSKKYLPDTVLKKKRKKRLLKKGSQLHSGDGTIPYLSLSWAHTWLLHAARAMRRGSAASGEGDMPINPLETIKVTHRLKGGSEWIEKGTPSQGTNEASVNKVDPDTGTKHPHGTKYKPEMLRFQSAGKSRTTGVEYTTTVIEAIGVEHKETTRNYDILAAVFSDVLRFMHEDMGLV